MSEQRANVPSYIERLRKPGGLPPFIQREVADILEWQVAEIKRLQARVEELEALQLKPIDTGKLLDEALAATEQGESDE